MSIAGLLAVSVVACDLVSKQAAEQHLNTPVQLVLGAQLALGHNSGVAFGGLGDAPNGLLIALGVTCVAAVGTAIARGWLAAGPLAVGLLLGGAIANLIDRTGDGRVTDFISLPLWPAFNLADAAIVTGVLLLVIAALPAEGAAPKPTERS